MPIAEPTPTPEAGRADLARDARPLRRVGLDVSRDRHRGRHDPAVPHGRGPLLLGRRHPVGLVDRARRPLVRPPEPARMARQRDRRSTAPGRREWAGGIRRTDGPVGDRGAPGRADAGLGGDPRRDLPRRSVAAPGGDRDRRSGSPASPSSSVRPHSVAAGRSIRWASPPASSPRSRGRAGSLFASRRAALPGRPLVATGLQMVLGGLVLAVMAALVRRARAPSTRRRSPATRSSRSPT